MPVRLLCGSEGPRDCVPAQAIVDVRIVDDVSVVVVIDERMPVNRVVESQRRRNYQKTQNCVALFGRGEKSWGLFRRLSCRCRQQMDLTTGDTEDAEVLRGWYLSYYVTTVTDFFTFT